ncbi:MAG: hypothetical protein WCJ30_14495, partial [Deltaproteobacteria bacterium]
MKIRAAVLLVMWCAVVATLGLGACTSPPAIPDAAGDAHDAIVDLGADAPPCTRNADCDDLLFCNGVERCLPSDPAANGRGCVVAAQPACTSADRCDETTARCIPVTDGGDPCDLDHDGQNSNACGGQDCDDHDVNRYMGNPERCGGTLPGGGAAAAHDEDCNPCTVAGSAPDGDADHDGFSTDQCVNPWVSVSRPVGCN